MCCSRLAAQKRQCSVACLPSHVTAVTHAVVSCRYRPLNSYFKLWVVAYTSHYFSLFLPGCSYYSPVLSAATWQQFDSLIYSHLRREFPYTPAKVHSFFIFLPSGPWSVKTRIRTFPLRALSVLTARRLQRCKPDASLPDSLIFICGFQVCVCVACLFVGSGLFALTACLLTVHLPEQRLKLPLPHLLSLRCLFASEQFRDAQSLQRNNGTKCLKKHICSLFYGDVHSKRLR